MLWLDSGEFINFGLQMKPTFQVKVMVKFKFKLLSIVP